MTGIWARFENDFPDHDKWEPLTDGAWRLGVTLICWARRWAPDGFIPERIGRTKAGRGKQATRKLKELVETGQPQHEHGLLELRPGGWQIHDFEQYGPPIQFADEHREPATFELREARRRAGRAGGLRSAEARREANGTAQPKQNGVASEANPKQITIPLPHTPTPSFHKNGSCPRESVAPKDLPGGLEAHAEVAEANQEKPAKADTVTPTRKRKATHVTQDWHPGSKLIDWCQQLGLTSKQIEFERCGFIDYWRGEGKPKADWDATFRNRIRSGIEKGRIRLTATSSTGPAWQPNAGKTGWENDDA